MFTIVIRLVLIKILYKKKTAENIAIKIGIFPYTLIRTTNRVFSSREKNRVLLH